MKTIFCAVFIAIFLLCSGLFFAQQEIEHEYVQVVNVEMLVRVMKDGRPLAGLQKGDFSLLENGRKQEINGFLEVHRRITPAAEVEETKVENKERPGRLFLIFFWINEPAVKVDEALDYFFNSIYREGDRVILADQRRSIEISEPAEKPAKIEGFKNGIAALSREMLIARDKFKTQIDDYFDDYLSIIRLNPEDEKTIDVARKNMLVKYTQLLYEFRLRYMKPNADSLGAMASALEPIDADKWGLIFYQHESLPLFDIEKLRMDDRNFHLGEEGLAAVEKANREVLAPMEAARLADSLRTRFIQANTQFHMLLLGSRQGPVDNSASTPFAVINPFPVFSNWENMFREVAETTGGETMSGDRMKEALAEVAAREDVYYVLTYAPTEGKSGGRRIDIRVGRDGAKVIHGRRVEMENPPHVKLAAIEETPDGVRLQLEDIYTIGRGDLRSGLVRVTLLASREGGKPSELARDAEFATTGSVEVPFKKPEPGTYRLAALVIDCLTGFHARGESTLDILGGEPSAEAAALLRLAAGYCERLRRAAFRFVCRETVTEDILVRDTIDRYSYKRARNSWLYDYQVVVRDGQVDENRVLLRKNKSKKRLKNAGLETRFRSLYSVFLPATLFAADKQPFFFYRVGKHGKMNGRPVAEIAISPRPGAADQSSGTAWVDEKTGAVLKVDLSQRSIKGIESAEKKAEQSGARLLVSDVHEYGIEREGIRLPSSTSISENYVINVVRAPEFRQRNRQEMAGGGSPFISSSGRQQLELSRTWVEYSDFRFFVVDVRSEERW